MKTLNEVSEVLQHLTTLLMRKNIRMMIFLQGAPKWQQSVIEQWIEHHPRTPLQGVWLAEQDKTAADHSLWQAPLIAGQTVLHTQLSQHLGSTLDFAVFHARLGVDANALAQAGGMIQGGGILWLGIDDAWPHQPNPSATKFLNHPFQIHDSLQGYYPFLDTELMPHAWVLRQSTDWVRDLRFKVDALSEWYEDDPRQFGLGLSATEMGSPTPEQLQAMERIESVATGHRRRPLLIHADRGRGKSSVLGMAAARLIMQGKRRIVLIAARVNQVTSAFQHAEAYAETLGAKIVASRPRQLIIDRGDHTGELVFMAPDTDVTTHPEADLIMIDEAAHLPLPVLQDWVSSHSRVVIASTDQGYEGSGRSFRLRFRTFLDASHPGWKSLSLTQPIRWAPKDPLEKGLQQALWLNHDEHEPRLEMSRETSIETPSPEPHFIQDPAFKRSSITMIRLKGANETLMPSKDLRAAFELLVQAHYQTTPNDLMQWLEVPNQHLWIARYEDRVLGVVLVQEEGGLSVPQPNQRFHGHLFPQVMWRQTQNSDWLSQPTGRIQRIAVHPQAQRIGIASEMIRTVFDQGRALGWHSISVSFGATPSLVSFWYRRGFSALHLGLKRDKASAAHSLAMASPLSPEAESLITQTHAAFQRTFTWQLCDAFRHLPANLVLALAATLAFPKTVFPRAYLPSSRYPREYTIEYTREHTRGVPFEAAAPELTDWTLSYPESIMKWPEPLRTAWVQKTVQRHPWEKAVTHSNAISRARLETQFHQWLLGTKIDDESSEIDDESGKDNRG